MYYEDVLAEFGAGSAHSIAACKGQCGADAPYLRTVAEGRFRPAD